MPFAPHPLLDLVSTSRAESWRFDLLDRDLNRLGTLAVDRDSPPSIEHNANRSIKRTVQGLVLSPTERLAVNPITDRMQPVMVLSDGTEWPLGVFLFADWSRRRDSYGVVPDGSFVDYGLLLDQPCSRNVHIPPGTGVREALLSLLTEIGVPEFFVAETTSTTGPSTPLVYRAGTSWLTVINDLASRAGFYSPAFDHRGVCRIVPPVPASDTDQVDVVYNEGGRILAGSIVESDNAINLPNRYTVIDTSSPDEPKVGRFDIPEDAPGSWLNRGFIVNQTIEVQGLTSVTEANKRARSAYLSSKVMDSVTFATPPDPRHDCWTTFAYRDAVYREQRWVMKCSEGAPMVHEGRRYYE